MHSFYRSHFGSRRQSKTFCTMWGFNLLGTLVSALCSTSTDAEKFEAPNINVIETDDTSSWYVYRKRNTRPLGESLTCVLEWPQKRHTTRLLCHRRRSLSMIADHIVIAKHNTNDGYMH